MKILHCCLANFYIDNYGYQENILPKMHMLQGHYVEIVASTETYLDNKYLGYTKPGIYLNEDGIKVTRIPYAKLIPRIINKKLRIYTGFSEILKRLKPDIVFLHDIQFISILDLVKYSKREKVIIYADCHTDNFNSARNWISMNLLHKIIYRKCAQIIEPYTTKFYGVLPARVKFLSQVYKINSNKINLLLLGADDSMYDIKKKNEILIDTRNKLFIDETDFVIVTGGKIDQRKNIHILIEAFSQINRDSIKLVIFGNPDTEMQHIFTNIKNKNIIVLGWINQKDIYRLLLSSNLGFFPGTHSVLWEQSIGVGLPCVFKKWEGIEHVCAEGNSVLLENISPQSIKDVIMKIIDDKEFYSNLLLNATNCAENFTYSKIASNSIEK